MKSAMCLNNLALLAPRFSFGEKETEILEIIAAFIRCKIQLAKIATSQLMANTRATFL